MIQLNLSNGTVSVLLDGACPNISQTLTQFTQSWKILHVSYPTSLLPINIVIVIYLQIVYTPFLKNSVNRTVNIYPSLANVGSYLCVLLQTFNWNRVGIFTQSDLIEVGLNKYSCM